MQSFLSIGNVVVRDVEHRYDEDYQADDKGNKAVLVVR